MTAPFLAPLVGRERERDQLHAALDAAVDGRGSLVLLGGEAGIGKTVLAEATLAEAAARGAAVLVGRCYDLAETPPYGPWAEALARAPHGDGLPAPPDPVGSGVASQAALFAQVRDWLVARATTQPLALLLEDLHWADPASLDLLRFLGRQLATLPLLLLATYRADELTRRHPLYALLPVLEREARAARLDLRRLDKSALHALVKPYTLADDAARRLVAWLLARAEGNAFFTAQLLRALEDEGALARAGDGWALGDLGAVGLPTPLVRVLDARVDRLGEEARRLLALAAVLGQEVPLALWAAVAEADEEGLLNIVERGVEARLLDALPAGDAVRFAHALIREALYEGVLPMRRRAWHRRAGEALAATPAPDPDAVAYHFQRAGDERAGMWLVRAGERAQAAYAWLTAAARYEAALALLEQQGAGAGARGWLAFRLAVTRRFAEPRRALDYAEAARRLAEQADDRLLAGLATFMVGLVRCYLGDAQRGTPEMAAGLDALDALPAAERVPPGATAPFDPTLRRGTLVIWLANVGRYAEAVAAGERYLTGSLPPSAADWLGGNPYADAHSGLGLAAAMLGQPERAFATLARTVELNRAVGHHQQVAVNLLVSLSLALHYRADRPDELRQLTRKAEEALRQTSGSVLAPFPVRAAWIHMLVLTGHWAEARELAKEARDTSVEGPNISVLAPLARAQGNPALAWSLLLARLPEGPQTVPGRLWLIVTLPLQRLAAMLAVDAGDLPAAHSWLEAHDRWLAWSGAVLGRSDGHLAWAGYHHAAGNLSAAREHAERALAHASDPRQPLALLAAHRLSGELDTVAARHDDAATHLEAALALADACEAVYERALTLLALVELRLATGDRAQATSTLAEARALLEPLAARPALARADLLAERCFAPPPSPNAALPFGLSAREAEVLRLVAQGLSNAQAAEHLFLSPRTIDQHLRSIYGKLGVENRTAATRLAVELGLA